MGATSAEPQAATPKRLRAAANSSRIKSLNTNASNVESSNKRTSKAVVPVAVGSLMTAQENVGICRKASFGGMRGSASQAMRREGSRITADNAACVSSTSTAGCSSGTNIVHRTAAAAGLASSSRHESDTHWLPTTSSRQSSKEASVPLQEAPAIGKYSSVLPFAMRIVPTAARRPSCRQTTSATGFPHRRRQDSSASPSPRHIQPHRPLV
mmetsp:Transcript_22289/g.63978  ORF Transcript_22289/g.63978 Transcript_22289/m.63978 type:complete len:211 (-) Transcript_22289:210-842(-)